jgi:hypothetical protein
MFFFLQNLGNVFAYLLNLIKWDWAKLWSWKHFCCTSSKQKIYFARFQFCNTHIWWGSEQKIWWVSQRYSEKKGFVALLLQPFSSGGRKRGKSFFYLCLDFISSSFQVRVSLFSWLEDISYWSVFCRSASIMTMEF